MGVYRRIDAGEVGIWFVGMVVTVGTREVHERLALLYSFTTHSCPLLHREFAMTVKKMYDTTSNKRNWLEKVC